MRARVCFICVGLLLILSLSAPSSADDPTEVKYEGAATAPEGSFALAGSAASRFELPRAMRLEHLSTYPDGRTSTRYQQVVEGAAVLGGQITVSRAPDGAIQTVVGAHFGDLVSSNNVELTRGQAKDITKVDIGARGIWTIELRINPLTEVTFYEVRSNRQGSTPVRWLDAQTGSTLRSFNAVRTGEGTGVKGDRKRFATSRLGKDYLLQTPDRRQSTFDDRNGQPGPAVLMADANDQWNLSSSWVSPDQRAGVDAHYYAGVVDRFYLEVFNRNSLDDAGAPLNSVVHVDTNMCNAFWDGSAAYFGDGTASSKKPADTTCLPISGALDVVAHEFTHGVIQYTSRLYAGPESGYLNEGFSDIMGTAVEFYAASRGLDPAAPPDWRFGEDVVSPDARAPGWRNLATPGEDGSLDHYSELTGPTEVHAGGTIAGHSFFLASVGGRNRGCLATTRLPATHTADCTVVVPALGITRAEQIFYEAFTSLQETANFCDARNASIAFAGADAVAIDAAWSAVGVRGDCAPTPPPPPTCVDHPNAGLPFESDHPYLDKSDCTWTFDNGTPGFAFHFSDLAVELGYDFVVVRDGQGTALGVYSGDFGSDAPLTCIPTSTGMVQLISDSFVTDRGFIVDSTVPC